MKEETIVKKAIKLAKQEIKHWQEFLKDAEKLLKELNK